MKHEFERGFANDPEMMKVSTRQHFRIVAKTKDQRYNLLHLFIRVRAKRGEHKKEDKNNLPTHNHDRLNATVKSGHDSDKRPILPLC